MIEKEKNKSGLFYFVVKAPNGQALVYSELYNTESARDNGIASLKNIMQRIIFAELKN